MVRFWHLLPLRFDLISKQPNRKRRTELTAGRAGRHFGCKVNDAFRYLLSNDMVLAQPNTCWVARLLGGDLARELIVNVGVSETCSNFREGFHSCSFQLLNKIDLLCWTAACWYRPKNESFRSLEEFSQSGRDCIHDLVCCPRVVAWIGLLHHHRDLIVRPIFLIDFLSHIFSASPCVSCSYILLIIFWDIYIRQKNIIIKSSFAGLLMRVCIHKW